MCTSCFAWLIIHGTPVRSVGFPLKKKKDVQDLPERRKWGSGRFFSLY